MEAKKKTWQRVDGVLLLDKPVGMSSNDALQKARRLFSAAKAGHTGTLDPLASGLLPLCFGEATKFAADLLDADKTYEAVLQLGVSTDSGDAEGQVLQTRAVNVAMYDLEAVFSRFRGDILQTPPMYSALKRDGRPLYELARQGIEVERVARSITIHELALLGRAGDEVSIRVSCSKGTYIRSLAMDIGEVLGCGAHLLSLRRTRVADLTLGASVTLDVLGAKEERERFGYLLPLDALMQTLARRDLDCSQGERFTHGNPVTGLVPEAGRIRVYEQGRLVGLGEFKPDGMLWPRRLIAS